MDMQRRLFVWFILASGLAGAQPSSEDHLFPIREGRKFGFINRTGAVIVPPLYDAVGEPQEGRIRVTSGSLSGYIDYSGKVTIEPKYESAGDFRESRAIVREGTKYALIDLSGKLIAEIPHRVLGEFHQGLLRVQASGRVDAAGKRLPTTYGFVDTSGRLVIAPQFMPAGEFSDDLSNLTLGGFERDWCYFDRTGKIIIRVPMGPNLNPANPFADGRLRVKEGFMWGYKDASGNWAIPPKYNDAEDFKDRVARVQDGAKWILINVQGKEVPEDKSKLRRIGTASEGLTLATENGLLGWVDDKGKLAFPLRKYDEAHAFSNGLARVKVDGLWGYVDRTGNLKIGNQYYSAGDFKNGLAYVQTREGIAYINPQGNVVWKSAPREPVKL